MRILMTGASSFTGSWFVQELVRAGHQVTASFRRALPEYEGRRGDRVRRIVPIVEPLWGVEFGDARFLDALATSEFDLLLHHGAEMTNYRSWDFDALEAARANTRSIRGILTRLRERGTGRVIVTGSVFEPYEGLGDEGRRAFNPYGLSKHLSFEVIRMEAERLGLNLGKFVIPNPFGPMEEQRFTSYLASEWASGRTPTIATPAYVRDNIHVSLLALSYRRYCENAPGEPRVNRSAPSGYVESQGAFARRFAREIGERLGWNCALAEKVQSDFPEPAIRTNGHLAAIEHPEWSETAAWDELAAYYHKTFSST